MFDSHKATSRTFARLCITAVMVAQLLPYSIQFTQAAKKTDLPFRQWLFEYIPAQYPAARMTDHGAWLQAHVTEELVVSWTQWNEQGITLKGVEAHGLTEGKAFFIDKGKKDDWANHAAVTYLEGAGYYCSGYDPATMGGWDVETFNIVQFNGDAKMFAERMAKAWAETPKTDAKMTSEVSVQETEPAAGAPYAPHPDKVVVTRVEHFGNMCWKIAAAGGTWYFENGETQGKSGFSSAFDQAGNDWIGNDADRGFNKSPSTGGRHEYRGWPNFGEGNFDHPQRSSGAKTRWVDAQGNDIAFTDKLEGDRLIMRSANANYELEYHFFPTHAAIKVLKADKKYAFLYEGPIGGEQDASIEKDYYVLKDGKHRECKTGGLGYLEPEFGNKFPSPFFYLADSDPKDPQVLYVGAKDVGPDSAGDEGWRQGNNMVIFSFGRDQDKRAYTGTDAVCVFGFHRKAPHDEISSFITSRLAAPFAPASAGSAPNTSKKLRVIMSSDFPPIGVVKGGNVPNTMKSDPDDMQSMVRFLLYANEFDIEGLIASAGTFAMEAHKKNILGVIDQYEKVYENLRKHDPDYPTPDYLRSVTFEGKGNNHGVNIKWGRNTQPYTDIIGEGMDSEASNAIIAAADKPDPRPIWIGVWGGPREVAQAIWDVKNTRSEAELKAFVSKLRIFLIAYQDATHGWLMEEFPDLFIIDSRKTYQGMFGGNDPISNLAWVNENIRHNHGPLCEVYPHEGMGCTGVCEGDSPTFLHLVSANRGINDPEDPTQPGWGGQYQRRPNTNHYVDGPGGSSISRWRKDYQKEFAERADWCIEATSAAIPAATPVATPTSTATPADTATTAPKTTSAAVFAVNCGGGSYVSSDGTEYAADTGYSGGLTYSNSASISGTTDDTLYHSERYGDCTYSATVPNGRYLVTLHFAETFHPQAGLRSFDVLMEGTEYISDLDMYTLVGGNAAYVTETYVTVSDGELNIEFVTDLENAKINAIKVSPVLNATPLAAPRKPRMVVLTDISPATHEPDDMESMIRLLVHADLFEIEGLIATTGWSYPRASADSLDLLHKVIDAYEEDLPNLLQHAGQTDFLSDESRQEIGYWPSPDYLRSRVVMGSTTRGQRYIGEGNDSPGSKLIVQIASESDDRPVWVQAWGGGNTLAQAIWRLQKERSEEELNAFLHKIRMYTITDQDRGSRDSFDSSSHYWMRKAFEKDLFFIWDECAWRFQNGTGKGHWEEYATHIQKHGHMGDMYPKYRYGVEGDTPAFLYIMPVGLNDPECPDQGSWGGYFQWGKGPDNETYAYTNHQDPAKGNCYKLAHHFYRATFNNFAARMDWAKDGVGNRNPVVVVNGDAGMGIITLVPQAGTTVTLDASRSHDPDGDALTFTWWTISGPGTYTGDIGISNSSASRATVTVPENSGGKTFHMICEVTDDGTHNLTSYRRIIFEPVQ